MKTLTRTRAQARTQPESPPQRHWDTCPEVDSDPKKLGGARIFKHTRLPLSTVYEHLAEGASIKDIVEWFPGVEEAQIKALLEHDAETLKDDREWLRSCSTTAHR